MNILIEQMPYQTIIDSKKYKINTDFRIGIHFELLMESNLTQRDKIVKSLKLYYSEFPNNIKDAIEQITWFYQCGEIMSENNERRSGERFKRLYSFEHDQYLIYTAFLCYYHIDLNIVEDLHWWKFKQMLVELPENSKFKKVIMYRSIKISSNMSSEQQNFYAEMKNIYKLPDGRTEEQKANIFARILAHGMLKGEEEVNVDE